MDQKIFELGLSVEIISAYLLCRGLADSGAVLSDENILSAWTGTREALANSLEELEKRNILVRQADNGEGGVYQIKEADLWLE